MIDLTDVLQELYPDAIKEVARAANGTEADPWPDADLSVANLQATLDEVVTWADGFIPPAATVIFPQIATGRQSRQDKIARSSNNAPIFVQLKELDEVVARSTEDLIDLLILKGTITEAELPINLTDALSLKKTLRGNLQ